MAEEIKSLSYDEPMLIVNNSEKCNLTNPMEVDKLSKEYDWNEEACNKFKDVVKIRNKSRFLLATAALFGHSNGKTFYPGHYKLDENFSDVFKKVLGTLGDFLNQQAEKVTQNGKIERYEVSLERSNKEIEKINFKGINIKAAKDLEKYLKEFVKFKVDSGRESIEYIQKGISILDNICSSFSELKKYGKKLTKYPKTYCVLSDYRISDCLDEIKNKSYVDDDFIKIWNDFLSLKSVKTLMKGKIGIFYNVIWTDKHAKKLKDLSKVINNLYNKKTYKESLKSSKPLIKKSKTF
jgi:hypothetical protein